MINVSKLILLGKGSHMASNIIQKNRRATRIVLVILGLLVIAGGGYFIYRQFIYQAPVQAASETLQTTTAKRGDLELTASGSGSYVAAATASIGFSTSGQIVELNARVGDKVEKGQVIAKLDSTSAQIAYDQANRTLQNLTSPAAISRCGKHSSNERICGFRCPHHNGLTLSAHKFTIPS